MIKKINYTLLTAALIFCFNTSSFASKRYSYKALYLENQAKLYHCGNKEFLLSLQFKSAAYNKHFTTAVCNTRGTERKFCKHGPLSLSKELYGFSNILQAGQEKFCNMANEDVANIRSYLLNYLKK